MGRCSPLRTRRIYSRKHELRLCTLALRDDAVPFLFCWIGSSLHPRDTGALPCNRRDCVHQSHRQGRRELHHGAEVWIEWTCHVHDRHVFHFIGALLACSSAHRSQMTAAREMDQTKIWEYFQNNDEVGDVAFTARPRYEFLAKQIAPGQSALNIGAGRGGLEAILAAKGVLVSSLDPGETIIERLRERHALGDRA